MKFEEYRHYITSFYKKRGWYDYDIFIRTNFLTEELGELSQAIRAIEIGRDRPDEAENKFNNDCISEELADILDNIIIIADKYNISFEEIINRHIQKLDRYKSN